MVEARAGKRHGPAAVEEVHKSALTLPLSPGERGMMRPTRVRGRPSLAAMAVMASRLSAGAVKISS